MLIPYWICGGAFLFLGLLIAIARVILGSAAWLISGMSHESSPADMSAGWDSLAPLEYASFGICGVGVFLLIYATYKTINR